MDDRVLRLLRLLAGPRSRGPLFFGVLNMACHTDRKERGSGGMAKLAIVATLKTTPGKRDEYLKHLKAHGERSRATEPGTLQFDIMLPHDEPDTILLYELYASPEAFQLHWNGPSIKKAQEDTQGMVVSLKGTRCDLVE